MTEKTNSPGLGLTMVLVALLSVGCQKREDRAEWWEGERQRMELEHQFALKDYQLQQSGYGRMEELEKLRASNLAAKEQLNTLLAKRSELTVEFETLEQQRVAFKSDSLRQQRRNAIGQTFKIFSTADGREFQNASVASVDDAGVTIRHADGSARLRFADLDPSQRDFFGLEESAALAAVQQESREALAYERWIDQGVAAVREKQSRASAEDERRARLAREERARVASQQLLAANDRALAQPAKSVGGSYFRYDSGYRSSRPTYRYIYQSSPNYCAPAYQRNSQSSGCVTIRPGFPQHMDISRARTFSNTTIPYIP